MSKVAWTKPAYHLSLSDNSIGYDQPLREKNLQLTEFKIYINNIESFLGIVDILSARTQNHQFNTFKSVPIYYKYII